MYLIYVHIHAPCLNSLAVSLEGLDACLLYALTALRPTSCIHKNIFIFQASSATIDDLKVGKSPSIHVHIAVTCG